MNQLRREQRRKWMWREVNDQLYDKYFLFPLNLYKLLNQSIHFYLCSPMMVLHRFHQDKELKFLISHLESQVMCHDITAREAAELILEQFFERIHKK